MSKKPKKPKGLICPRCGCSDFRNEDGSPDDIAQPVRPWETVSTIKGKNYIRRYKSCRYCGKRVRTKETIES